MNFLGAKSTRSRASKRTKLSDDLDGFEIQWEWENDGSIWTAFQVEHSQSITTDCQQYKPKVLLALAVIFFKHPQHCYFEPLSNDTIVFRLAPMWQQSGTLLFCSCHGIARFLVDELQI